MRKILGRLLLALGAFLLVLGVLTSVWAPGAVKKTPIDVDSTTRLTGEATRLGVSFPIKVTSITKSDTKASTDETAVFVNTSCVVNATDPTVPDCVDGEDPALVSASVDTFATDRTTALAVDSDKLPADSEPHEGLINKWPFDAQKKTYPVWDGLTGQAWDAEFVAEEELLDLDVHRYRVTIEDAPIEIAEGTPGTYSNVIDYWVEPRTGAIMHQTQDQQRYLEDGTQVLDLQAAFTDQQQQANVEDAEANAGRLELLTETLPLVGFIGGALCLLAGAALLLTGRSRAGQRAQEPRQSSVSV